MANYNNCKDGSSLVSGQLFFFLFSSTRVVLLNKRAKCHPALSLPLVLTDLISYVPETSSAKWSVSESGCDQTNNSVHLFINHQLDIRLRALSKSRKDFTHWMRFITLIFSMPLACNLSFRPSPAGKIRVLTVTFNGVGFIRYTTMDVLSKKRSEVNNK